MPTIRSKNCRAPGSRFEHGMTAEPPEQARTRRHDTWVVALIAAVLFLPWLGARDLWNPNEPTYGQAVEEMIDAGNWLVPTVGGEAFFEKPILYFWMARVTRAIFGHGEFALRLPIALLSILSAVWTFSLARDLAGRRRAWWSAAAFASTFVVAQSARMIQMDSLVLVFVLGAMLYLRRAFDGGRGWLAGGLCAGLGMLAKGPVVWVLIGGILCCERVLEGRMRDACRRPWWRAVIPAVLLGGSWYVALWVTGRGDGVYESLVRQNFARFVDAWDHAEPFYYYLYYFWIDFLPWVWLVPLAVAIPGRSSGERSLDRLSWVWLAVTVAFFSLSDSKRSAYLMPVAPAVAWLAASVVEAWIDRRLPRWKRAWFLVWLLIGLAGIGVVGTTAAALAPRYVPELRTFAGVLAILGFTALFAALLSWQEHKRSALPWLAAVCWLAAFTWISWILLPRLDPLKSPRPAAEMLKRQIPEGAELACYRCWPWRAGLRYYGDLHHENLADLEAFRAWWARPGARCLSIPERNRDLDTVFRSEALRYSIGSREYRWVCRR